MRPVWKGALSFGLIHIPVGLYTAAREKTPSLHYLHRSCGGRVQYRKVCSVCGQEVSAEELAHGAELPGGGYVEIDRSELAEGGEARALAIRQFVPRGEVDPLLYKKGYFLWPDDGGEKAFGLLTRALWEEGREALLHLPLRGIRHLALVRPRDERHLALHTLYYPDEAVATPEPVREGQTSPQEEKLAKVFIQELTAPFAEFAEEDPRRQAILARIREAAPQAVAEAGQGEDLLAALKRSLAGIGVTAP